MNSVDNIAKAIQTLVEDFEKEYPGKLQLSEDYMFKNDKNGIFVVNEEMATAPEHYIVSAMNILALAQIRFGNKTDKDFYYFLDKVKQCREIQMSNKSKTT